VHLNTGSVIEPLYSGSDLT